MAVSEVNYFESGGGSKAALYNTYVASGNAPSWSSTPFKANKIYMEACGSYQNALVATAYVNYDPSTGVVDTTGKCWAKTIGSGSWYVDTRTWTITDTSVSLSSSISGVTAMRCQFAITDGDFEEVTIP